MPNSPSHKGQTGHAVPDRQETPRLSSGRQRSLMILAVCLGLALLVFAGFLPTLRNGFVNFDDPLYVTDNPHVQKGLSWEGLSWALGATTAFNWHPLTWLTYMADFQIYGLKPGGYHLTNVLLHTLNTCLVLLVLRRLTGALWRSLVVAALFGLHPLRVESVAWVAERKDVLSALFFLLTVWAYTRYAQRRSRVESRDSRVTLSFRALDLRLSTLDYCLALVFFALGLMSKPMLVTLPFVLLLLDYWPLRRLSLPPIHHSITPSPQPSSACFLFLLLEKVPFFALAGSSSVITLLVQKQAGAVAQTLPFAARAENALVAYGRYLGKLFWPVDLCVLYPHPDYWPWQAVVGGGLLLLAISALVVWFRAERPYLLGGWLWFIGMLVPVIGLVQVGQQSMADRYTYLPMIGVLLALVWAAYELSTRWRYAMVAATVGFVAVSLGCMVFTRLQIGYWSDGETLFRHAIAVTQHNALAHGSLARALADKGQIDEAIEQYRQAAALDPNDTIACNGLGNLLAQKGDIDGAISQFREALRRRSGDSFGHNNLGLMLARKGMMDAALAEFLEAVKFKPKEAEPYHNLGILLAGKGRLDEAIQQYREAVRIKPDYAKAHKNLGVALARKGLLDEAIAEFQAALQAQPDYPEARKYLADTIAQRGVKP